MATETVEQNRQLIVDQLKIEWQQLRPRHERICELAYQLWKATPKNGCAGQIGATLAEIGVRKGTFYAWVKEHRITSGEIPDDEVTEDPGPLMVDEPKLEIDDHPQTDDGGGGTPEQPRKSTKKLFEQAKYNFCFEGKKARAFQQALTALRQVHQWGSDQSAIYHCVIEQARLLTQPSNSGTVSAYILDTEGTGEAA